jgi:ribonuclease-3
MTAIPEEESETPAALVKRLGLPFTDLLLVKRALTHRSYRNEHPEALEDNERLEFLGDAVLDFVVGAWLYNRFPEMPEGDLTRLRAALVCTEQLATFARLLNLGQAMLLGRGEIQNGGRERALLLCSTFEALIGALYLQAGIQAVQEFVTPLLEEASEGILLNATWRDPKSRLQEWSQQQKLGLPHYITVQVGGPEHDRQFEVEVYINGQCYGRGRGHSKQEAARQAAAIALTHIQPGE